MALKRYIPEPEAYDFFHEGLLALSWVEHNGIRVDTDYLTTKIAETKSQIKACEEELKKDEIYRTWRKRYGEKSNLNSRQQLAEVIFKQLGHKQVNVDKNKYDYEFANADNKLLKVKADEAAFANVKIPFVSQYFRMQKLIKANSTYLQGILRETVDGFCHPSFNLHTAITYRSSADMPNFQNMPIRNKEIAELIRQAFISRKGYQLGEVDFGGIEVRVAACYNHDPNLIKYINDPTTDMHRDCAADLFMLPKEYLAKYSSEWSKKAVRDWSKNRFVFPSFYGSVYFQTAADLWQAVEQADEVMLPELGISIRQHLKSKGITKLGDCDPKGRPVKGEFVHHVQQVEKIFWEKRFRVYAEWKKRWFNAYLSTGGLRMYTGLCCQGVFKRNDVINYPVQGSAFHCLLWCLIQLVKWLRENKMRTRIVGQIHDSIVADIHPRERDDFFAKCREVMTKDLLEHWDWIIVPMEIECEVCPVDASWHKKEVYKGATA